MENGSLSARPYRVLIVIQNLSIGGFTKSLLYLLQCMKAYPQIAIDLWLLEANGDAFRDEIPETIGVITDRPYIRSDEKGFRYWFSMERVYYPAMLILKRFSRFSFSKRLQMYLYQHMNWSRAGRLATDFSFTRRYDCVVSWEEVRCNYAVARNIHGSRKVGYVRPNYTDAGFAAAVDKKCFKKMDAVAAVSESGAQTLRRVFPRMSSKMVCVPNRKNIAYIRRQSQAGTERLERRGTVLVTAARLDDRSKALFRQVHVAGELKRRGCRFVWYMIGDGPDRAAFEKAVHEAGLQQEIILLGARDNPLPLIAQADLFVLQSYYEGRPNAVDEAKILGVPVFVTDYPSAGEQVPSGEGFIASNNREDITDLLEQILKDAKQIDAVRDALAKKDWSAFEDCRDFFRLIGAES